MIKNFGLLLTLGFVLGLTGLAFAADQSVTVTIGEDVNVVISPDPLNFGALLPGSTNVESTNGPIIFNADGSNVDVTVAVTAVTGFPFEDGGLLFDGTNPIGQDWFLECTQVTNVCTYSTQETTPTLSIPEGVPPGLREGTITYTVTGPSP